MYKINSNSTPIQWKVMHIDFGIEDLPENGKAEYCQFTAEFVQAFKSVFTCDICDAAPQECRIDIKAVHIFCCQPCADKTLAVLTAKHYTIGKQPRP